MNQILFPRSANIGVTLDQRILKLACEFDNMGTPNAVGNAAELIREGRAAAQKT